jgi:hypothetical protein
LSRATLLLGSQFSDRERRAISPGTITKELRDISQIHFVNSRRLFAYATISFDILVPC